MEARGPVPGSHTAPDANGADRAGAAAALASAALEVGTITAQPAAGVTYPPARASQADVLADAELFTATLREVLQALGSSLDKVPRMAGRELDLHQLYRNVSALGGCLRVTAEKKWREAGESFSFPDTITSVSYQLRKAYQNLLWDYEQVYLWRAQGARAPPPSNPAAAARGETAEGAGRKRKAAERDVVVTAFPPLAAGTPMQLTASAAVAGGAPEALCVGRSGTVRLDARFDAGYFVSVRVAGQDFRGMLYYPPACQARSLPAGPGALAPPPRACQEPFGFFHAEARQKIQAVQPHLSPQEITRRISELWTQATEVETEPYAALANMDRIRYQSELEAYNYRLATEAAAQQAAEAAQQVAGVQQATAQAANPIYLRPNEPQPPNGAPAAPAAPVPVAM